MKLFVCLSAAIVVTSLGLDMAHGQSDTQLWAEGSIGRELSRTVAIGGGVHFRFDRDISELESAMPELELAYRVANWLRVGPGYRLEYERTGSGDFTVRHRLVGDANLRFDAGPVSFGYRVRLQESVRKKGNQTVWRNKFGLGWRGLKPWSPGVDIEFFSPLRDDDESIHVAKVRFTVGTQYQLSKSNSVEVYYRVQEPEADPSDPTLHIFGLGYNQKL
jgi:hypothetical protein